MVIKIFIIMFLSLTNCCLEGYHKRCGHCIPCPKGYYNDKQSTPSAPSAKRPSLASRGPSNLTSKRKGLIKEADSRQQPQRYTVFSGSTPCKPCKPGTFTTIKGSRECIYCFDGYYAPDYGSKTCYKCPINSFTNNQTIKNNCTPCPEGFDTRLMTGVSQCYKTESNNNNNNNNGNNDNNNTSQFFNIIILNNRSSIDITKEEAIIYVNNKLNFSNNTSSNFYIIQGYIQKLNQTNDNNDPEYLSLFTINGNEWIIPSIITFSIIMVIVIVFIIIICCFKEKLPKNILNYFCPYYLKSNQNNANNI
jgi:hypothetical protein